MEEIIELINKLGDLIIQKKGDYKEQIKKLAQELSDEKLYGSETISLYEDSIMDYKQLVAEKDHLIGELEERLSKYESQNSEIAELEIQIESLTSEKEQQLRNNKILKEKIAELEAQLKEEDAGPKVISEEDKIYTYKFGRTSRRIMTKCVEFLEQLYNGADSGEIIELQNPELAKSKSEISEKQFNVFMDRLSSMEISGNPIIYEESGTWKTKFKLDFLCEYLTQII